MAQTKHARATAPMAQDAVTARMARHPAKEGPVIIDIRATLTTGGAPVTAAQIGQSTGTIGPATAAAPVLAGVLSVVLFPGAALTVLAGPGREVPR